MGALCQRENLLAQAILIGSVAVGWCFAMARNAERTTIGEIMPEFRVSVKRLDMIGLEPTSNRSALLAGKSVPGKASQSPFSILSRAVVTPLFGGHCARLAATISRETCWFTPDL